MLGVFGFVFVLVTILIIASTFRTFMGFNGIVRDVMDRAVRMQHEEREHERRMAELAAERSRPWNCAHCDSQNPAAERECLGCGAPREEAT